MREWDPIGVAGIPEARDEYDSYLGLVADRLRTGAHGEVIAALLESIRCEWMEQQAEHAKDVQVADAIGKWYAEEMSR